MLIRRNQPAGPASGGSKQNQDHHVGSPANNEMVSLDAYNFNSNQSNGYHNNNNKSSSNLLSKANYGSQS